MTKHTTTITVGPWTVTEERSLVGRGRAEPSMLVVLRLTGPSVVVLEDKGERFVLTEEGRETIRNASMRVVNATLKRVCGRTWHELNELLRERADAEYEDMRRFGGEE